MKLLQHTTSSWSPRAFAALALLVVLPALASLVAAQPALHPVNENGRTVWTNDVPKRAAAEADAPPKYIPSREYFYWSTAEQRWVPVMVKNPDALRSAKLAAGEVSQYIDSKPKLTKASASRSSDLARLDPNYSRAAATRSVSAAEIDKFIDEAAARHKVDPNLVRALVKVESNYNPRAVSSKGAIGLMQLMPSTARHYDVNNPFDAKQNVDAGVRHLKGLLNDFNGNVPLSLAAYNAGESAVQRHSGIPPYQETRNYVRKITNMIGGSGDTGEARAAATLKVPISVTRDERGHLLITNTN